MYIQYPLPKEIKTQKDMTTMFMHMRTEWYFYHERFFTWEACEQHAHLDLVREVKAHRFPNHPNKFWEYMKYWA